MQTTWYLASLTLLAVPLAAQQINPTNQINWPQATGSGAPTASCSSANYGQPYTDVTNNQTYTCSAVGWIPGGGLSVSSINGVSGAFTFSGAGVSCSSTTCTFSGGSGGGIGPGAVNNLPYYSTTTAVSGDSFFSDTAPTASGNTGRLTYTGPGGASFSNTFGGSHVLSTTNANSPTIAQVSQITLNTITSLFQASASNPGLITISTDDSAGMAGAGNINITAQETNSTSSGAANVNITAQVSGTTSNSGNVNITSNGDDVAGNSGNINLTANQAVASIPGANITIQTQGTTAGANTNIITLDANGGVAPILFNGSNVALDSSGDLSLIGTLNVDGLITSTTGLNVTSTSGVGGSFIGQFGTAPAASSGTATLYADSASSRLKMNNANTGAVPVTGTSGTILAGDCAKFAANGIDIVDFGGPCNQAMTGTPTFTADSGAGTSPTVSIITTPSASTDGDGFVSVIPGTSPVGGNVGLVNINYGGTYAVVPKCSIQQANANSAALSGATQVFVSSGSSNTTAHFVIFTGSSALTSGTTYIWHWHCSLQ